MSISVKIEKNYNGFHLQQAFESSSPSLGILGASGSGKSLTLRCIAGIEKPDRGRIVINENVVFDSEKGINLKPQQRKIGYLFQNYALFPTMTVQQNIACGFTGDKKDCAGKVLDYIKRYRLEGLEKHYPHQLSGGQQQRTALARMMIGKPGMILLDEPFSALDGYLKDILMRDMQDFLKTYKGDMILVTHSRDEAYKFCRQLVLLNEGKTMLSGDTREVFEQPGFLEAARLTGCKNYSRIRMLDDHHVLAVDWDLCLRTEQQVSLEHTWVGVRGHWLRPSFHDGENCMSVDVTEYIETTFEQQYIIKNSKSPDAQAIWWMRPKHSFRADPYEDLPPYLYFPPEHLMLLC